MRRPYEKPEAELIRFRPREPITAQDEFQDTMELFEQGDVPSESGDIEVNPWG